jgi:hypothetical protein
MGKSPLVFFSSVPLAQMYYCEALQDDGRHGEVARQAWGRAADDWNVYGLRPILTSSGNRIRLNDKERKTDEAVRYRAELENLIPGARDLLYQANLELLSKDERAILDTPVEKRDIEQHRLAYLIETKINVTPSAVAEYIRREAPDKTGEAMRLAHLANQALTQADEIDRYRQIVNFEYWRARAKMEQSPEALLARQKLYEARVAFKEEADLIGAKRLYEEGFQAWRKVFDDYPIMIEAGTLPEELVDETVAYKEVWDQNTTAPFPQDFILRDVVELRDQEGKLKGLFTSPLPPKQRPAIQPLPEVGRPPEPADERYETPGNAPTKTAPAPTTSLPALPEVGRPPEPSDETAADTPPNDVSHPEPSQGRPPEPKADQGTEG